MNLETQKVHAELMIVYSKSGTCCKLTWILTELKIQKPRKPYWLNNERVSEIINETFILLTANGHSNKG